MSAAIARSLSTLTIAEIGKVMSQITGNQFTEKHYTMIEFRLKKRCLELQIESIEEYYKYFIENKNTEVQNLISLLTTHHTFFFREFAHFQYLEEKALPALIPIIRQRADRCLKIWSAACSKGHEVYSLAMCLEQTLQRVAPDLTYRILATDIDPESVAFGKNGVYTRKEIKEVPMNYMGNHWTRGTGEIADFVKAKASLRDKIEWKTMNLLALPESSREPFDIIFCRNVFIYFNPPQIKKSSESLLKQLAPHGFYFIGLSESLNGLGLPIASLGPSIYTSKPKEETKRTQSIVSMNAITSTESSLTRPPSKVPEHKELLRILCVDDSPSILTLLKKILSTEAGFEVVGTASNGLEAAEKLHKLKPDIITLDIHMPHQNGVEYLQKNFNSNHPPVVMVTSVFREDSELALSALHLGASDYVEKPAFSNLQEISDEVRRKLRSAYRNRSYRDSRFNLELDDAFKKVSRIQNPENYFRLILAHPSDYQRIESFIREVGVQQPPTLVLIDGPPDIIMGLSKKFSFSHRYITT